MEQPFDASDPYQVHAYLFLGFICSSCGVDLDIESTHEMPGDAWCFDAASQARREGWLFPPAANELLKDSVLFCRACLTTDSATNAIPPTD